jgi:hypothetical protein
MKICRSIDSSIGFGIGNARVNAAIGSPSNATPLRFSAGVVLSSTAGHAQPERGRQHFATWRQSTW